VAMERADRLCPLAASHRAAAGSGNPGGDHNRSERDLAQGCFSLVVRWDQHKVRPLPNQAVGLCVALDIPSG
jgi:hypothetical protein